VPSFSEIKTGFRCALSGSYNATAKELAGAKQLFSGLCNSSITYGSIATVVMFILMLRNISDAAEVPRRAALALDSLFFGFFLSEVVFAPLKRNVEKLEVSGNIVSNDRKRILLGMLVFFVFLTCLFVILYALYPAFQS
jgi:flagellar motor component MotA